MSRVLLTVATYNERESLPVLVERIFASAPQADLLIIDDNSPDGTGQWADQQAEQDSRVSVLHREGKLGLGSALIAGMKHAIEQQYAFMLNLDADLSHPPENIPDLLAGMTGEDAVDVMIGSRYVAGGGSQGWPWHRRLMSRSVNRYARILLGLRIRDCSGAFRCYRVSLLEQLDFSAFRSMGYAFQEEVLWRLKRRGARFGESPIIFVDRKWGQSKINKGEAIDALCVILRLGLTNWLKI